MQYFPAQISSKTLIRHIIMISGYRGSGKDTLYSQLSRESTIPWNWNEYSNKYMLSKYNSIRDLQVFSFIRVAFANPLKEKVHKHHPFTTKEEMRPLYIQYGSKKREKDKDYWCKKAFEGFEINPSSTKVLVVTDWRFPNEYIYAISKFGIHNITTIRVIRKEAPPIMISEPSETSLDNFYFHFILTTDDSIKDTTFYKKIF